jgi:hypothetical protein
MTQISSAQTQFISQVEQSQTFYGLQDPASQEWVILDSINFENKDAMPLWSTIELAQSQATDEWKEFTVTAITLADWLEFWVEDLSQDDVLVGIDWADESNCEELSLDVFTQALIAVEKYV